MTLRIRELVIRAEVGGNGDSDAVFRQGGQHADPSHAQKPDSMTRRFYEEDPLKENER